MTKLTRLTVAMLAGWGALGCDGSAAPATLRGGSGGEGGEPAGAFGAPAAGDSARAGGAASEQGACGPVDLELANLDAADLFGYAHIPTFDLYLDEQAWEDLQANAQEEQYAEAQACFEGRSIGRVGMRFKGSYGSLYNCFDVQGQNTCRKLGIKVKFSEYDTDRRFYGLKRLNFQGYRYDDSYLKEKLAYETYRAMSIVAPRASWAVLRVNDELQGLFGMVEQIDGRFTNDRWPDNGDQNLYKEVWPIQTDRDWVLSRLKTNEETADVDAFLAFAQTMNDADEADLRATLGGYMDLDALGRYMAVDDAIANYDGITAYYTSDDAAWAGNHNFYLYQEDPHMFTMIPWDLESTFVANSGFGNVPRWTEVPEDCSLTYPVWRGTNLVIAPGCDRIFRAIAADLDGYRDAGQELLDGPFAESTLLAAIDEHAAYIQEEAENDPNGPGASRWASAVAELRAQVPQLRARFEGLLSGEPWVPFEIDVAGLTDFENQDTFGLTMGPMLLCNSNSTVSVAVNTEDPLAGSRDLVMSFEYGNETDPWQQWSLYLVPLASGVDDLTGLTGIRMWVRADRARSLRFDIDSPNATAASEGIRFGWDVPLTTEAAQVEVLFADAAMPQWAFDQGRAPADALADILATTTGLAFFPQCTGVGPTGLLPEGTTDPGFFEVDDIEFF
jgi:hypothetical protein